MLRWNERFHVDGQPITDEHFAQLATKARDDSQEFARRHPDLGPLTWFEFITVLALNYFRHCKVDVAVIEVGLGGRFDATNVLSNILATVITNVQLDHMQILGATKELIAGEKAGIVKIGSPVVTAAKGKALAIIEERAKELDCPVYVVTVDRKSAAFSVKVDSGKKKVSSIDTALVECGFAEAPMSLSGKHQKLNALLAFCRLASDWS